MTGATPDAGLPSLADADWLTREPTRIVFAALTAKGAQARAVGGAVRNALLGLPVTDVDIATTRVPMRLRCRSGRAEGCAHGDCARHGDGHRGRQPYEVTTLRKDVETHGRHATVAFTDDWTEDARRRDFTLNALYCSAERQGIDPSSGYADLMARRVRFIGDAGERIREDYLRILRSSASPRRTVKGGARRKAWTRARGREGGHGAAVG